MDATLERHLTAFRARREQETRERQHEREMALLKAKTQLAFGGQGELFKALREELTEKSLRHWCPNCGVGPNVPCLPDAQCDIVNRLLNDAG